MNEIVLRACAAVRAWRITETHRLRRDERGEGVISAAIAVLIMAFLGALMWIGFRSIWLDAAKSTDRQVSSIGQ